MNQPVGARRSPGRAERATGECARAVFLGRGSTRAATPASQACGATWLPCRKRTTTTNGKEGMK